ncbi:dephospho-CoA kinase [Coprothermobacteraceae bacterium]|nr:dephospho-CoA kinase [Coprothermobacteraceae bacterium]
MGRTVTLGIGGWTGTGKSSVAEFFARELGAYVVSLDLVGHDLYSDPEFAKKLQETFGTDKRDQISELVQKQPLWDKVDSLFHPYLKARAIEMLNRSGAELRLIEGSLLLKLELDRLCDYVVWVTLHPLELAAARTARRASKPYAYGLNILQRQLSANLCDPGRVDLLAVQTSERTTYEVYLEIRKHLRI